MAIFTKENGISPRYLLNSLLFNGEFKYELCESRKRAGSEGGVMIARKTYPVTHAYHEQIPPPEPNPKIPD
jgi:hypothetical protein